MFAARKYRNRVEEIFSSEFSRTVNPGMVHVFRQCCETQRQRGANEHAAAVVWAMVMMDTPFDLSTPKSQEHYLDLAQKIMATLSKSSDDDFEVRVTVMWSAIQKTNDKALLRKVQGTLKFTDEELKGVDIVI